MNNSNIDTTLVETKKENVKDDKKTTIITKEPKIEKELEYTQENITKYIETVFCEYLRK